MPGSGRTGGFLYTDAEGFFEGLKEIGCKMGKKARELDENRLSCFFNFLNLRLTSKRLMKIKLCSSCPYKKDKLLNLSQEKSAHFQAIFWQGEVLRVVVTATTADVMHTYAAVNNSG